MLAPYLVLALVVLGMCASSLDAAGNKKAAAAPQSAGPAETVSNRTSGDEPGNNSYVKSSSNTENGTLKAVNSRLPENGDLDEVISSSSSNAKNDPPLPSPTNVMTATITAQTEDHKSAAVADDDEENHEDRISLILDDAVRAKHGPVAFWLAYEATPQELQLLTDAESIQQQIDALSRELEETKRIVQGQHRTDVSIVADNRDVSLDAVRHYWSRKWSNQAPSFWQFPYWSTKEYQQKHTTQPRETTVMFLPVDDEVFLKQGLTHLRCRHHHDATHDAAEQQHSSEEHHHHQNNGALLTLEFSFSDAPDVVYPFMERHIQWSLPVSMAQRFETVEHHRFQASDMGDLLSEEALVEHRHLGNGTHVHFRPEVVDAAMESHDRNQQSGGVYDGPGSSIVREVLPHPSSFFYLFAPSQEHRRVSRKDWERVQSRLGALVRDVCHVTARFNAEDDVFVAHSSSEGVAKRTSHHSHPQEDFSIDHDDAYERWLREIDHDSAVFDQPRAVDEL